MSNGDTASPRERIAANLASVKERMLAACRRAGRAGDAVQLVGVTKSASLDEIRALIDLGVLRLGESRPQQLASRAAELPHSVEWHLIGPLQRNKARKMLPLVSLIHSVDSFRLLESLDRLGEELSLRPRVLLEVNVSGERSKQGFSPVDLMNAAAELLRFPHLEIRGLMTMAPESDDPESARPTFRGLRTFCDELQQRVERLQEKVSAKVESPATASCDQVPIRLDELSMGMSGDFEIAIEEGATLVRVGSLLFQ